MRSPDAASAVSRADRWFVREVLPLEAQLMQFLHRNWHNQAEIADLRQETYIRVYEAALKQPPDKAREFVFTTARHLIIDRVRRARVIPIDAAADLEFVEVAADMPGPDQVVQARPSCLAASKGCRAGRWPNAWASPNSRPRNISNSASPH